MKHFKNITNYKNLKEQYKQLLKANHPDNGGDLETMQEINSEYDILFRIWKDKAIKDETITKEEEQETARSTRKNFYTAFGWEGSRYDSKLTLKEIAVLVRTYVKEKYPTCKFSVRTKYASMCQELHVDIKEFPDQMYKTADTLRAEGLTKHVKVFDSNKNKYVEWDEYTEEVNDMIRTLRRNNLFTLNCWDDEDIFMAYEKALENSPRCYGIKTEFFKSVLDDVDNFVQSYNYDDSDSQIDYFDNNFYYFGCKYDECKQVEKVARIKNQTSTPATTKEPEEKQIETSGELFTIEESKHTKTGEKIYLVRCLETLTRDAYINLNQQIKQIGGYYSKFTHSFIFKEDPTEALKGVKIA